MIEYQRYQGGEQIYTMKEMIDKELSEPYTIYTYRYFVKEFP